MATVHLSVSCTSLSGWLDLKTGLSSQLWQSCAAAQAGGELLILPWQAALRVEEPRGETPEKLLLNWLYQGTSFVCMVGIPIKGQAV